MPPRNSPELLAALLLWVQTFRISPEPKAISDLRDGRTLYQILHDIDPEYFPPDGLPGHSKSQESSANWIGRWQDLKHIERGLSAYERDVCGVLDSQQSGSYNDASNLGERGGPGGSSGRVGADLKAIAQAKDNEAEADVAALLKRILRAAMYSPNSNQRMGRVVMGLGGEVAATIASAMASMDEEDYAADGEPNDQFADDGSVFDDDSAQQKRAEATFEPAAQAKQLGRDLELEHEERLIQAHRIIRQLEESNAKAAAEFEDLKAEKLRIEESFEALKFESSNGGAKGRLGAEDTSTRELRERANRDRDYIAELESELESAREAVTSSERSADRLKASNDAQQKLKDDVQLLRAERDELLSRTRANENLRKKIQNLQDAERASGGIREELQAAQEELTRLRGIERRAESLAKTQQENMNIIANTEQEIFDQKTARKRLEHELRVVQQKFEIARERGERDKEAIAELEARLAGEEEGASGGLEGEMSRAERPKSRSVSLADTAKKNDGGADASAEVVTLLEERLKILMLRNKSLEEQYLDVLGDKLGLETTLSELKDSGKASNDNVPYLEQRKKLHAALDDASKLRSQVVTLTTEAATVKARLFNIQGSSDVGVLDPDAEYAVLTARYKTLALDAETARADLVESRALLRYALLSARGVHSGESDEARRGKEYALVRLLVEEARNAGAEDEDDAAGATMVDDVSRRLVARIEAAASGSKEQTSSTAVAAAAEATELATLRKRLAELESAQQQSQHGAAAAAGGALPTSKEEQKTLSQLRRENRLVASAWLDLGSRIQRDNVTVGIRRRESPKSWLGRQRAAVGLGVGGVR